MTWARPRLEEIAESVDYGYTASASNAVAGPKFLRITDIQDGLVDWSSVPRCECPDKAVVSFQLREGDIVFARTGATTGKSFLLRHVPESAVFASYLIRVQPRQSEVYPGYLARYFETQDYWAQISRSSTGTAQGGVNASKLKALTVPLPPLPEQRRIAAILDKADKLRAKRREAIAKLDQLLQSVFLNMFGDPVTNPKGWPKKTVGELASFITSGSRGWASHYADAGALFIRIQNLVGGELDLEDCAFVVPPDTAEARRTLVQPGDVLVSITADLGRTAAVPSNIGPAHINQHIAILRLSGINPAFVSHFLASPGGQQQFQRLNRAAVKAGLNFNDLRSLEVFLPPQPLQEKYLSIISKVRTSQEQMAKYLEKSASQFASLQQLAFAGTL